MCEKFDIPAATTFVFTTEKAKTVKDLLDKKTPAASTITATTLIL